MYLRLIFSAKVLLFVIFFRPFFTYWATFIQVVIYIVAVSVYGIAPIGFEETEITSEVLLHTIIIKVYNHNIIK